QEGVDLGLKTPGTNAFASLLRRIKIRPGQHGQRMRRRTSDFGRQLREKQKVKYLYGILEKQFHLYYEKASRVRGVTGELLLQQLEQRLDNVVYRLGFAPTRAASRQLVRHGHVLANEKTVTIPSYKVLVGDVVRLRTTSASIPQIKQTLENKATQVPEWLQAKGIAGKVMRLPVRDDVHEDIQEQLIVEFYSR
ncbi:30S ribosomal protein S4, partial [Candidatus Roizmanbacteria bacterium RIFCSPLOWO2_01_FULL_45_11]